MNYTIAYMIKVKYFYKNYDLSFTEVGQDFCLLFHAENV